MTDLARLFRAEGIRVRVVGDPAAHVRPGAFTPQGITVHHTGDKGRGDSGLALLTWGRDLGLPSQLLGPLCNASPREDGELALISLGRANHAGMGSSKVLDRVRHDLAPLGDARDLDLVDDIVGNGWFYGLEVDNDGGRQPYSQAQYDTTVRACAALCRHHGWTANRVIGHKEWTRRKVDWSLPMPPLRANVADRLRRARLVDGVWTITSLPPKPAARPAPLPQPAPVPALEVDMQVLMKTANDPRVFITDGVTKRHVTSQAELRVLITAGLVKEQITQVAVDVLAAIPTVTAGGSA